MVAVFIVAFFQDKAKRQSTNLQQSRNSESLVTWTKAYSNSDVVLTAPAQKHPSIFCRGSMPVTSFADDDSSSDFCAWPQPTAVMAFSAILPNIKISHGISGIPLRFGMEHNIQIEIQETG